MVGSDGRIALRIGGWWWLLRLLLAVATVGQINSQDISACCSKAESTCRSVCEKMSLAEISSDSSMREERIQNIYKFCAPQSIEFWICMNHTIQEIVTGLGWWGRGCCQIGTSTACRHACATAKDVAPLKEACRQSDEIALFDCVQSQEKAQWCCSQADSLSCFDACQKVLWRVGQARVDISAKERALEACERSPMLLRCLDNMTAPNEQIDSSKYLPCCSESSNPVCKSACTAVLRRTSDVTEISEVLQEVCGQPTLHNDAFWPCFLMKDNPHDTIDQLPHAADKLHCCKKAATINCRSICLDTFNVDVGWQKWKQFDAECLVEPQEVALAECIEEIEYPCSLGCSGMTYCSHLNNHHSNLFRFCSPSADFNSHFEVASQGSRGFVTVSGYNLVLKKNSSLSTDLWKTVTCALNVKPCTKRGLSSLLCLDDCVRLVSASVDWSVAPATLSAHALCSRLAPRDASDPCVPLTDYTAPSTEAPLLTAREVVTSPCSKQLCAADKMCVIDRNCGPEEHCRRYSCVDGCPLGDRTDYVVPIGSYVRVPSPGPAQKDCYKICRCTNNGLGDCQPLPCVAMDDCRLHDKVVKQGEKYYLECNACACVLGERVCARRACGRAGAAPPRLPCACPPHHMPVRARHTLYPNVCLAKCAGATDAEIEFGSRAECAGISCPRRHACLPRHNVCLSRLQTSCPQHVCVNTSDCLRQPSKPVCDSDGHTYENPCHLVMGGAKLAYWGPCLRRCSAVGVACGVNGVTYISECAAWAEFVTMDYKGPCLAVGPISDAMDQKCTIDRILCPPLKKEGCMGFTAPGACCPKCGGAVRILYSKKQIDRALYGTNISATAINLHNILKALERHVTIAECALRGYLTIETEIFVSVETLLKDPTDLQLQMCVLEAEKLADMINKESVVMSVDLGLSALSYALPVHTYPNSGTGVVLSTVLTVFSYLTIYVLR